MMYFYQCAEECPHPTMEPMELRAFPVLLDLNKTQKFFHFLEEELLASKTRAEKEVVLSELLLVDMRIQALQPI